MKFKKFIASLCCASLLIPQIYIDVNAEEIDVSEDGIKIIKSVVSSVEIINVN